MATIFNFILKPDALLMCILQQRFSAAGNITEGKHSFSGKSYLYGLVKKVFLLLNQISIDCSNSYYGSVFNSTIFKECLQWHKSMTEKSAEGEASIDSIVKL